MQYLLYSIYYKNACNCRCMPTQVADDTEFCTKTTEVSVSVYNDNDNSEDEPNYEEVNDDLSRGSYDAINRGSIYISNYSEPLPLKDIPTALSKDYADPYDTVKSRNVIKRIKRLQSKNKTKKGAEVESRDYEEPYDERKFSKKYFSKSKQKRLQRRQEVANKGRDNANTSPYMDPKTLTETEAEYAYVCNPGVASPHRDGNKGEACSSSFDTTNDINSTYACINGEHEEDTNLADHYSQPFDIIKQSVSSRATNIKTKSHDRAVHKEVSPYMVPQSVT